MQCTRTILFGGAMLLASVASQALALDGPYKGAFAGNRLELDNIAGHISVAVGGDKIAIDIAGQPEELAAMDVRADGQSVRIKSTLHRHNVRNADELAQVRISVPKGTALSLDGVIGHMEAGDTGGDISVDSGALKGEIGAVKSAHLDGSGAIDLTIGDIAGDLDLDSSGAAKIKAKSAASAHLDISGASDVDIGALRGGFSADINGHGRIDIGTVNGPVNVDMSGAGEVLIKGGRANPLRVEVSGVGRFEFDGDAVDPNLEASGLAQIKIRSYTGKLHSSGGNITIGK